jgi:tetratricopeptide (TPR) repeat protein
MRLFRGPGGARTATQIDQFLQSLGNLRGDPSFARAVEEARRGNTRIAEGIWRQIYEDRERTRSAAQREQAEAARNLAASAVTNNVAEGLSWYHKAVALDSDNVSSRLGLGDAAMKGGTLKEAEEAFHRYKQIATSEPERAVGLSRIGDVQVAQGDLAGAMTSYRDSLAISVRLAKLDPGNARLQRAVSDTFDQVGDVQVAQGNLTGAEKSYRDSYAIRERLAKSDCRVELIPSLSDMPADFYAYYPAHAVGVEGCVPSNTGWQRDLSASFEKIGHVLVEQGRLEGALQSYLDSGVLRPGFETSGCAYSGGQL